MPIAMVRSSERGAVLMHVVIALSFLIMIGAFVMDYGALLGARTQSQSAADAGALAGAYAIAFDTEPDLASKSDRGRNVAWNVAHWNVVWGENPGAVPTSPYPMTSGICSTNPENCVRVDVYRDGTNGSTSMSTWLGRMFGTNAQGIKASAVAQTAPASGSNCLKPWLIPDRFQNNVGSAGSFDPGDVYTPPSKNSDGSINYGTGYTPNDIGVTLTLKPGSPNGTISPGDFFAIDDPNFGVTGGSDYGDAIAGCVLRHDVGDTVSVKDGNMIGPTQDGFNRLLAANGGSAVIAIGMFNPQTFTQSGHTSGNQDIDIVNMLGFRVDENSWHGNSITGTIVGAISTDVRACTTFPCPTTTGLLSVIRLVR